MTRSVVNFALFQLVWLSAVGGAAEGFLWLGPAAASVFLVIHLRMVHPAPGWRRELAFVLVVGLLGTLVDSTLHMLGVTVYPTSTESWPYASVPPWITALWVALAMLPRYSLRWLAGRPLLAMAFGAVGGPLSYLAGTRFGAVALGEGAFLTLGALAIEYALLLPFLFRLAPEEAA